MLARDVASLLQNTIPLVSSLLPALKQGFLKMISYVVKFLRAASFSNALGSRAKPKQGEITS